MTADSILIVEDNPITRKMVWFALEQKGYAISAAGDGRTALKLLDDLHPGLVLQDLLLPDMDGFELVARLRARPAGRDIPILAFSGFLTKRDEARISAAGFDDLVVKPVEPSRLLQVVAGHLAAPGASEERFGEGRRLVVADDDPVQLKLASFRLGRAGFVVRLAQNGREALELARLDPPDAILSDVMMPKLDGFGLCLAVREDARLARVPVVLVTSSYAEEADRALARRVGANDLVLRTPDLADAFRALRGALSGNLHAVAAESAAVPAIEAERAQRIVSQLEKQVALNAGIAQRCSMLGAELAVLAAISDALARQEDMDAALDAVLAACFDTAGVSMGALYFLDPDGTLRVRGFGVQHVWDPGALESFFGEAALLRGVITRGVTVSLPSPGGRGDGGQAVLERAGAESALIVPLRHREGPFGALVMMARGAELNHEDWRTFAQGVANQIAQAHALAGAFQRVAASERHARDQAAAAQRAERTLRELLDRAPDGIAVRRGPDIVYANPALRARLGDGLVGTRLGSLVVADDRERYEARVSAMDEIGTAAAVELRMIAADGETVTVELSAAHAIELDGEPGFLEIVRDVTERKRMELQLMIADRMASVGVLAAGVAHEMNNPLAAILANLRLAGAEVEALAERSGAGAGLGDLRAELGDAAEAAKRLERTVLDMKVYAHAPEEDAGPADAAEVMESSLRLARTQIDHRARVVKRYEPVAPVVGNASRLGQVFLNLLVNAAQAIGDGPQRDAEIRIAIVPHASGMVAVEVRDTGPGIPPAAMRRLFTPFFTTKPVGIGTGLGLSICQRIIQGFGGAIEVESAPGDGATFRVLLCAAPAPGPADAPGAPPPTPAPRPAGAAARRGRVLVVDDEPLIGSAITRGLRRTHDVVSVMSAREALDLFAAGERFDLVLCDLMMPGLSGLDFHDELARAHPEDAARIVFLTGGATTPAAEEFLERSHSQVMEKPFEMDQLRALADERVAGAVGRAR